MHWKSEKRKQKYTRGRLLRGVFQGRPQALTRNDGLKDFVKKEDSSMTEEHLIGEQRLQATLSTRSFDSPVHSLSSLTQGGKIQTYTEMFLTNLKKEC